MPELFPKAGGITQQEAIQPFFLYGGESDIVSDRAQVAANTALPRFRVVAFDAGGFLVPWDGTGKPAGIVAEPVASSAEPTWAPFFSGGQFNMDALVWPAATDTAAERRAAFAGTNIGVHRLP